MSYTTIWLHCVWCTKNRECYIPFSFRPDFLEHLRENAILKMIALDYANAYENHVHALINLGNNQNIASVMHLLKGESSFWINHRRLLPFPFEWQDAYYAVSVSPSHVEKVRNYIKNQDEHHRKFSLDEELKFFR